jgi:hypothetical protein
MNIEHIDAIQNLIRLETLDMPDRKFVERFDRMDSYIRKQQDFEYKVNRYFILKRKGPEQAELDEYNELYHGIMNKLGL